MALEFTTSYLADALSLFRMYKRQSEKAIAQVTDEQLSSPIDAERDSIGQIVKHMAGNMRSRWTDFLASDGEKPDRDRDGEFENPPQTRVELMEMWNQGWAAVFGALEPLSDADLGRAVTIRGEVHSVMQAVNRQLAHYSYHCGQINLVAKYFAGEKWQSLTVPRGKSDEFLQKVLASEASQR
jgi:hypothetical protein